VCGHKPSFGVIPQRGYVSHPSGGTTDADVNVFGPLGRSVDDLSLLLDVMATPVPDQRVAWSIALPDSRHEKLSDFRVAAWLDDETCPVASDVGALLEGAAHAVATAGASVDRHARPDVALSRVWDVGLPLISAATSPSRTAAEWEASVLKAEDSALERQQSMRYNASVMRHRDWLLLTEEREADRQKWAAFFKDVDVLLCPVAASAAFPHIQDGGLYTRTIEIDGSPRPYADLIAWTSFIGYVHLPSTVVPVGITPDGLPVGIQVVAPYLEDRTALQFASHIHTLLGGWTPPPIAVLS